MSKNIAVIYTRFSSDRQNEQSIEGQVRSCREYAERNGFLISNTYIDRATTGTNDNRAEFQQMLSDSSTHSFNCVLVYKFDRFARNRADSAVNKAILKKNGVKVVSATEHISENPEGILMEAMLEGYAEYFSAELSQKVKRGIRESRLKGNFTGGNVLYGYKIVDMKYLVDESKAEIVRRIFNEYAEGSKIVDITARLNADGITYRGNKPFVKARIPDIMHNEKYLGIWNYGGMEYLNIIPAIIEK